MPYPGAGWRRASAQLSFCPHQLHQTLNNKRAVAVYANAAPPLSGLQMIEIFQAELFCGQGKRLHQQP
jgi:hypothetical protein